MTYTNYHSHCYFCDGKDTPEVYLQRAIQLGMPAYGISSHAPLPYELSWPMKEADRESYVREIERLKEKYTNQIEVYRGLEVDFIPGVVGPSWVKDTFSLDYTIGSVHFVDFFTNGFPWEIDGRHQVFLQGLQEIFANNIEAAICRYYALVRQMVREDPPDIVGHLDKIKIQSEGSKLFNERATWYEAEVEKTLDSIAEVGLIMEVNTRGIYKQLTPEPYPSYWILERMRERNIPIMLNSDAHHPREISSHFAEVTARLSAIGYEQVRVLYQGVWQDVARFKI
ncbi:histidinol-phosphatase [Tunicatimonas pelagia]|uniref:histidinol-phosphatase n=1 Tax=Tunicatimonas pelagia TaxID=931531 RepID=UPI0026653CF1|nr:histidinol-phosphatase [Tunicatimonas pelagia]WKN41676.1 histidinol-phosphatase [Tunicatimonas pelagia]